MGAGRRTFGERSGFDLSAQPKVESGETGTKLELCPSLGVLEERGFPLSSAPLHSRVRGRILMGGLFLPACTSISEQ